MDIELIIAIGSTVFLLLGTKLWQKSNYLIENGRKAKAVIFKNNSKSSSSGERMYYPVVRFTTDREEWITQELSIGYSPAKPEGTKLEVIYDPEEPTNVEINSALQLVILPRLFFIVGLIGLIIALMEYLEFIDILTSTNDYH